MVSLKEVGFVRVDQLGVYYYLPRHNRVITLEIFTDGTWYCGECEAGTPLESFLEHIRISLSAA